MQARHAPPSSCVASHNGLKCSVRDLIVQARGYARRTVFGNVVQVVPSDDDCAGHFCRHDLAGEDATTDGNFTGEGAFLV
jgi:hypothetical protein